jgi:hypothetical protein
MRCCVFRRDKTLPIDADLVNALYRGVLRREPGAIEINNLINALSNAGSVEHALKDMLSSHEFGVMALPDLINSYVSRVPDNPVFFLHVPKTAGTSFRLALSDSMGVPAFLLYVRSSWQGFGRDATMRFWPLWAGHGGVSAFPQTHRGVTVFREARSRTLSSFRQQQKELATGDHDGAITLRRAQFGLQPRKSLAVQAGFSKWVSGSRTSLEWFIDTPLKDGAHLWNGLPSEKFLKSLSPSEVRSSVSRSLSRFDAAAWAHDSDAMVRAIGLSTGIEKVSPPGRENQFESAPSVETIRLTSADLKHLTRIAQTDQILISVAVEKGLIPPLDPDFADAEFEKTAQRLGFILP